MTPSKQSNFGSQRFRPHWLRYPLMILFLLQTSMGLLFLCLFTSLYRPLLSNYSVSSLQISLTGVFFLLGVFIGCPLLFFFRKYFSLTSTLRIVFVLHAGGSALMIFIKDHFNFVLLGQTIIGFCICFYSHHQSEFCLYWFSSKSRRIIGSVLSIFVYIALGSSSVFPLIFMHDRSDHLQIQFFLTVLCVITCSLSLLLLLFFREQPPKGYGLLPMKEQKRQEILEVSSHSKVHVKHMESINPLPPFSPRSSHLSPLPDLTEHKLFSLLFRYSIDLLSKRKFIYLTLIYGLNNSSLVVICVFLNMLTRFARMSPLIGSLNVFAIAVVGLISTLIHSMYSYTFVYHTILLVVALLSLTFMFLSLYIE